VNMNSVYGLVVLLCVFVVSVWSQNVSWTNTTDVVFQTYPPGCDVDAAAQCEYDNLICKLFTGPANDPATLCRCGGIFYGECLRKAGVREKL
jgi:hypothetical protein